ncbi:MAG: deoxyhypusine synthase family protein, partial [Methanoculleus horonobensis]|nr:deoxyhypusine synthase family protein [Methanoculleus horonobensis]
MKPTQPVKPNSNITALLESMSKTGFQGRKLGESLGIWTRMVADPDCTIFMGLSGAMIPAGMQNVLIELVKHRYVDVIVSTGAN